MSSERRSTGFASLAAIVVGMLIVFVLIVLYLRAFGPAGSSKGGPPLSALDAAKRRAQSFEEQQKKRLDQMQQIAE